MIPSLLLTADELITTAVVSNQRSIILPLLGERAGVRASIFPGEERASN
jgi:hypothetical protein